MLPLPGLRLKKRGVALTPQVEGLIANNCPVAIGVSGGKDSSAVANATVEHLRAVGHTGAVILIHSDLGRVEWKDSLPSCERLAARLGVELVVVRRKAGDMLARWIGRWQANRKRWLMLSCVKLILPWSTPSMRFCTAELKRDVICSYLSKRFRGQTILNVTGIRRDESTQRAKKPVTQPEGKLCHKKAGTHGLTWNAIIEWPLDEVFAYLDELGFELHEAYTRYGCSRVSCCFCILGSKGDLRAASTCEDNQDLLRWMVDLEIESTFAFQDSGWLGDVAPELLDLDRQLRLTSAKAGAALREHAELEIPDHLLYEEGWPKVIPTREEAELLGRVRAEVAFAVGLEPTFTDPDQIVARYEELMAEKNAKPKKGRRRVA
jgi:3'-phosphoadenosine 5'-phosphosulfate sulfotransferase (PAPS reductase)/FAD synthetase